MIRVKNCSSLNSRGRDRWTGSLPHDLIKILIKTVLTNADGRIDEPLLSAESLEEINYELLFFAGDYLKKQNSDLKHVFLDKIPIRFFVNNKSEHYHVPLLLSPFGYSTYRGS